MSPLPQRRAAAFGRGACLAGAFFQLRQTIASPEGILDAMVAKGCSTISRRWRGACRRCLSFAFGEVGWLHPEDRFNIEPVLLQLLCLGSDPPAAAGSQRPPGASDD